MNASPSGTVGQHEGGNHQNLRMRRPYFMPYMNTESVERGLRNGELIKGVLRINQRNFEESFIDNPEGDGQQDIMILGLHDRNRSLHGDEVVVRLKGRNEWVVRDSQYEAWKAGQMKAASDEAGTSSCPPLAELNAEIAGQMSGVSLASQKTPRRKLGYRLLGEMAEEDRTLPDVCLQKTAEVVSISSMKNSRTAVGQLKMMADGNRNWGFFSPNDSRFPRMVIAANELPQGFFERPHDFSKYIYIAKIAEWQETAQFARGTLCKNLGTVGDVEAETEGLLMANDVDSREFPASLLASLPLTEGVAWSIDEAEFKYRKDFRNECLFTIDPLTARDLDDALHVKPTEDCDGKGTKGWEVGVHIADVSYFLKPNTDLDKWAADRATSVYLVHKVIPMLPRILCEELCSLNPGVDRLTFSVVWKMDEDGNIKSEWFGRSVIHSCAKLAYEHAQVMIENPDSEVKKEALPEIFNGKQATEIKDCVVILNSLAQKMKRRRMDGGSLRLDAEKLKFALDKNKGLPIGIASEERKEANFLVEEFMLLANQAVARKIEAHFPGTALLRRHPSPKQKVLRGTAEKLDLLGYPVDIDCNKSIALSLADYYEDPQIRSTVFPVIVQSMMKCMQLAVYFCSGTRKDFHHYALNMDFYTHFTSPIRRYPDVIVHRLLAAALDYSSPPEYSTEELEKICVRCNEKKLNAKTVSDQSAEMFFALFIKEIGSLETLGVVIGVLDAAVDVLLPKYGLVKRVYTNKLQLRKNSRFIDGTPGALILYWEPGHVLHVRNLDKEEASGSSQEDEIPQQTAFEYDSDDEEEVKKAVVDDNDGEKETYRYASDYDQSLTVFSMVRLVLNPAREPVKFVATLLPTPDKYRMRPKEIQKLLS